MTTNRVEFNEALAVGYEIVPVMYRPIEDHIEELKWFRPDDAQILIEYYKWDRIEIGWIKSSALEWLGGF